MDSSSTAPHDSDIWAVHPEGGSFASVWRSALELPADALPEHPGPRVAGSCIAYRLRPGERSRWHRVRSTELWLWQGGGDLRLRTGGTGLAPGPGREFLLGPTGVLQAVIAPGEWQSAEPARDSAGSAGSPGSTDRAVVVACVVVPGFDWADWEVWSGD